MAQCAINPISDNHVSLCDMPFEIENEEDKEEYGFAELFALEVTCDRCKHVIATIHKIYTPTGEVK